MGTSLHSETTRQWHYLLAETSAVPGLESQTKFIVLPNICRKNKEKADGINLSALTKYQSSFRPPCAVENVRTCEQARACPNEDTLEFSENHRNDYGARSPEHYSPCPLHFLLHSIPPPPPNY